MTEALSAQQLAPQRYQVRFVPATLTFSVASGAWLTAEVLKERLPHATCAPCDASRLPGLDRGILGPERQGHALASNAALAVTMAGAGVLLARRAGTSAERTADLAVYAQTLSVTAALTAWSKVAFHRPRPVRYTADAGAAPLEPGDGLSFPSGHASLAFAAAAAYASIQHRRGGGGGSRTASAALLAAATATAVLRVTARRHFPTDALAGAVLGGAVGWIVPAVYPVR